MGVCENLLTVSQSCGSMLAFPWVLGVVAMKSLGIVMGAPNTSSAKEHLRSSLGAVRMPSNTHGSASDQLGLVSRARREVFKCQ